MRTRRLQTKDGINLPIIEIKRDKVTKMSWRRASRILGRGFGAAQARACPDGSSVVCWFSANLRLRMLGGKIPVADAVVASFSQRALVWRI